MSEKLTFEGVGEKDVYNITAPFEVGGVSYIAGRVGSRGNTQSQIMFFTKKDNIWARDFTVPVFDLEDPFIKYIGEELIFGGVQTHKSNKRVGVGYRTIFYKGKNLNNLKEFARGPDMMKDIRLIQLSNKKIGVFTRPQGGRFRAGRIGFIIIESLEELNPKKILEAKIIKRLFRKKEWGGANELHLLKDGRIGVLGHIAYKDRKEKHYFAMIFIFDPSSFTISHFKIIARRSDFFRGHSKRQELTDIVFPGGLIQNLDKTITLYTGLSDAEAGRIRIPNPFLSLM